MNVGKKTLEFRVGDLLLVDDGSTLSEKEITAISNSAKAICFDGVDWQLASDVSPKIKGKIGRVVYKGFWPFKRRVVIRK